MATLALKPLFPIRTGSSRPKRVSRRQRLHAMRSPPWRTMTITTATIAIGFFCVAAPMIGDPAGRLFALETTSTLPLTDATGSEGWATKAFEFTPTTLGPAIAAEMLAWADEEVSGEEDWVIVTMPALEVRAWPPAEAKEATPPG